MTANLGIFAQRPEKVQFRFATCKKVQSMDAGYWSYPIFPHCRLTRLPRFSPEIPCKKPIESIDYFVPKENNQNA
jgi:hypothetical protein